MTNHRLAASIAVLALTVTACGSQVDRSVFTGGGDAAGAVAGPGETESGFDTFEPGSADELTGAEEAIADPTVEGPSSDGGAPTGEAAGAAGGSGAPSAAGATGPAAQAKANYASDTGVTAGSIKIGNITTIGGPMPGQFEPWLLGVRTWANEVNERGGINGRKVQLLPCDDAMDAERNRSCARDLIEKQQVFALVGTNTPAMPSAKYINDQKVPAVGVAAIGNYTAQYPYWFSADGMRACPRNGVDQPGQEGYCASNTIRGTNGSFKFFRDSVGVKKAAVFWHNIDISKQAGLDYVNALEQSGVEVVYTAETQVAEPDYTGHVLKMKDRGVEGVWEAMEINNNIRLLQAMDRQGFTLKAKVSTASSYSQEIGKQVTGPARNSLFALSATRPYTDTSNPAIAQFNKLFDRYFGGESKHIWNVEGYKGALLFEDATKALGADVTREGLVSWLNALENYDPHGLGLPLDYKPFTEAQNNAPKPHAGRSCFFPAQFKDTDWFKFGNGSKPTCPDADWVTPRTR